MGTSLALVGSYVLAGELGPADNQADTADIGAERLAGALGRYQAVMRPYVDKCQKLPNRVDRFMPNSETDIAVTALTMKYMQRWPFRPIAERMWFTTADSVDLPDYPRLR